MKITLKDGVVKEFDNAVSVLEIAKSISEGLARNACAGIVDGEVKDLRYVLIYYFLSIIYKHNIINITIIIVL